VVPGVIGPAAHPADGPAAALQADVVGAGARDQQRRQRRRQRQRVASVLQQQGAAPRRLVGQAPVVGVADAVQPGLVLRLAGVEEAQRQLGGQDAADGVVDARERHGAALDRRLERVDEAPPVEGHHDHVDARVDRALDADGVVGVQLVDRRPVADHEALEAELALEHVGEQVAVRVHPHAAQLP
jgi:hypothetical protein